MRKLILFSLLFTIGPVVYAFDHSHTLLDQVMKAVNKNGKVNYKSLKKDPSTLNAYLKTLNSMSEADFNKWPEAEQITFWTNAYNAFTLKAIIDNYPIKSSFFKSQIYPKNSIRQIDGVWDKLTFPVIGKKMTLNDIEHETLRKKFVEPRIHMALVCAAKSCPPLREEAYTAKELNAQFDDQSKQFLSSNAGLKIDAGSNTLYLSKIFDWFSEDFVKKYPNKTKFAERKDSERAVLIFVSQYLATAEKQFLDSANYSIEYLKYDWSLNEQ